jgi:hypothetical protein
MSKRYISATLIFLYGCATLQFVRYYCKSTDFYLNMSAYLNGYERLPFQERVLPILVLRPMYHSQWLMRHLAHGNGAFTPELGPFYMMSLLALAIAAIYTQKLYELVSGQHWLRFLVFPVFLFTVMWTYSIHSEADFSYPYDLPSLAFFAAGLYYIYKRSFIGVFLVVLIGTFNRETTLFLIGIYAIDMATRIGSPRLTAPMSHVSTLSSAWRERFDLRQVPWLRVALLGVIWAVIKFSLAHEFARNSNAENFLRIDYNLARLSPRLLPALLNICGYTIPVVVLFAGRLKPMRFQNYLFILPLWVGIMFCSGVLLETRIYGELCSFAAVALVLIMEESLVRSVRMHPVMEQEEDLPARMVA